MTEYIDKSALYEKIAQLEELARNRYLETPSNSPCYSRYMSQLNERTAFKHIIEDFPSADVAPVRYGRWIPEEHEDRVSPTMTHRYRWYHCSLCGRRLIGYSNPKDAPYCHCGAKMNEEKAHETDPV